MSAGGVVAARLALAARGFFPGLDVICNLYVRVAELPTCLPALPFISPYYTAPLFCLHTPLYFPAHT